MSTMTLVLVAFGITRSATDAPPGWCQLVSATRTRDTLYEMLLSDYLSKQFPPSLLYEGKRDRAHSHLKMHFINFCSSFYLFIIFLLYYHGYTYSFLLLTRGIDLEAWRRRQVSTRTIRNRAWSPQSVEAGEKYFIDLIPRSLSLNSMICRFNSELRDAKRGMRRP